MSGPLISAQLTPKQEIDAYASITVPIAGSNYNVSITKYRCANTAFGKDPQHGGTQDAVKFKDKLLGASGGAVLKSMSATDFVGVFMGKGARADIVTVLQWCDQYGLLDKKLDKQKALQQICDDNIGLDCNGFVGNWANDAGVKTLTPTTPPATMGQSFIKNRRSALEEIQPYDIFYWNEHVAAVDSIGPVEGTPKSPRRRAIICEAYGAIMCQERIILPGSRPGYFQVAAHPWAEAQACSINLVAPAVAAALNVLTAVGVFAK